MPIYFILYFNLILLQIVSRDSQDIWVGFCYFVSLLYVWVTFLGVVWSGVLDIFNYASSHGLYNAYIHTYIHTCMFTSIYPFTGNSSQGCRDSHNKYRHRMSVELHVITIQYSSVGPTFILSSLLITLVVTVFLNCSPCHFRCCPCLVTLAELIYTCNGILVCRFLSHLFIHIPKH